MNVANGINDTDAINKREMILLLFYYYITFNIAL